MGFFLGGLRFEVKPRFGMVCFKCLFVFSVCACLFFLPGGASEMKTVLILLSLSSDIAFFCEGNIVFFFGTRQ